MSKYKKPYDRTVHLLREIERIIKHRYGIDTHRAAEVLALAAGTGADVVKAKATRQLAERLLKCESLRSCEFAFLRQMSTRRKRPSEAQEKWLRYRGATSRRSGSNVNTGVHPSFQKFRPKIFR
jgi:hypothetical protein